MVREREIVRFADNANYRFGDAPREREKREDGGGVKIRLHVNASFFKVSWIFLGYACSILLGSFLRKKGWLNVGETSTGIFDSSYLCLERICTGLKFKLDLNLNWGKNQSSGWKEGRKEFFET